MIKYLELLLCDSYSFLKVEFESKLAEGTHASVYKGIWNGMEVAIKQFREEGEKEYFTTELLILRFVRFLPCIYVLAQCTIQT